MDLEERVKRLEDRVELNDLIVGYFLAADGDDLIGVGEAFADDATFSSSGAVAGEGRDAIVAFIKSSRQQMGLTIHTPHYAHFNFESTDAATGLVGAHLELVLGGQAILGAVRYVDRYTRIGGSWLISARDMRTIHLAPWAEVSDAFASDTPVRWPGSEPAGSDYPRKPGTFSA